MERSKDWVSKVKCSIWNGLAVFYLWLPLRGDFPSPRLSLLENFKLPRIERKKYSVRRKLMSLSCHLYTIYINRNIIICFPIYYNFLNIKYKKISRLYSDHLSNFECKSQEYNKILNLPSCQGKSRKFLPDRRKILMKKTEKSKEETFPSNVWRKEEETFSSTLKERRRRRFLQTFERFLPGKITFENNDKGQEFFNSKQLNNWQWNDWKVQIVWP